MAKITSLILLLTFSCILFHALCLNTDATEKSNLQINTVSNGGAVAGGKQENWFVRGLHPHPWPFVHPPIPAAGGFTWPPNRPWPHWEYVSPPRPAGGYTWHFVNPPMPATGGFQWPPNRPWPHWEFVQPPVAAGSQWPPKDWPHWHFVQPPMPSQPTAENDAKTTVAAPTV